MHKSGHTVDQSSRSLSTNDYFYISERIRKKYNVISKIDNDFQQQYYKRIPKKEFISVVQSKDKYGNLTYLDKNSSNYYSYHFLWS